MDWIYFAPIHARRGTGCSVNILHASSKTRFRHSFIKLMRSTNASIDCKNRGRYFYSVFGKDVGAEVPAAFCGKHFPEIRTMSRSTFLLFTIHSSIRCLPFNFFFSVTLKTAETRASFCAVWRNGKLKLFM